MLRRLLWTQVSRERTALWYSRMAFSVSWRLFIFRCSRFYTNCLSFWSCFHRFMNSSCHCLLICLPLIPSAAQWISFPLFHVFLSSPSYTSLFSVLLPNGSCIQVWNVFQREMYPSLTELQYRTSRCYGRMTCLPVYQPFCIGLEFREACLLGTHGQG